MASILWGNFNRRDKILHCIHEEQRTQQPEPQEEPIVDNKQSLDHVAQDVIIHVDPSGVDGDPNVQSVARDSKGRCLMCRQEQLAARRYRIRLIIGIFFPYALSALDTTIVASALSVIASDFGKLSILVPGCGN